MKNFRVFKYLLSVIFSSVLVVAQDCPSYNILYPEYVQDVTCNEKNTLEFNIYEDCPPNILIIQIEEGYVLNDCPDIITNENATQFGFSTVGDAENKQTSSSLCPELFQNNQTNDTNSAIFYFVDVDEFSPYPTDGVGISQSVYVDENTQGVIYPFNYTDNDEGEYSSLNCTYDFDGDAADTFEIVTMGTADNKMMFNIVAMKNLDFELNPFYSLQAQFSSEDSRGNSSSVTQTFLIFVQDLGDNPPFFTKIVTFIGTPEEQMNVSVFQVQAQDRDFSVNNAIMYSIVEGNEEEYFWIDELTGEVFTATYIDRESLSSTTFTLQIEAQEVFDNGTFAPGNSSASEITNVNIEDINDNIPTFSNDSVSVTIDEFDDTSPATTINLDIDLIVTDMDEGESGEYSLTTDNENVVLNPTSGSGETSIGITLRKSQDFDYEVQADDPEIIVQITATEMANSSHVSEFTLTIHLLDVNDNYPIFDDNEYNTDASETILLGTSVFVVTATDDDASPEYNTDNMIYSISGCNELIIDSITGNVTLAQQLNFEDQTFVDCTVTASDMNGTSEESLSSQVPLTLNIIDVNDENPVFVNFVNSLNISEETEVSTNITVVEVTDLDTTSDLNVVISSIAPDVESWFKLVENSDSTPNHYKGTIIVNTTLDHETTNQVSLIIQATDTASEVGDQVVEQTLIITIDDVNDVIPQFDEDYSQLDYDEQTSQDVVVLVVQASDPDTNDELSFSIIDPENYLKINETTGEVSVANEVDREVIAAFTVTVTVEDLVNHTSSVQIAVTVNDINDNSPELDFTICTASYNLFEDAEDGQSVTTVKATDNDVGIHAEISYLLQNLNQIGSTYQFAPFIINIDTGEITVNTSGNLILDREQRSQWELYVEAYDNCDSADPLCSVNHDSCVLNVEISDVNDNPPGSYVANEDLQTDEFLMEDEIIPNLEISALDPDEENSVNSMINFNVQSMWGPNDTLIDPPLFEAFTQNRTSPEQINEYYCNLFASTNLTGLRGEYIIEILGTDLGTPVMNSSSNFTLTITDANDMIPEFSYSTCLGYDLTIVMQENVTATNVPLNCTYLNDPGSPADIYVSDNDQPNTPNSQVTLGIDYEESIAIDGGADNQLTAFVVYSYVVDNNRFGIATTEIIDRERGSAYNLSLIAYDHGDPIQTENTWIYILVVDVAEYFPTFCSAETCQQTLTISENTNDTSTFIEAEDKDNSFNQQNQPIIYSIIDFDVDAFYIPDEQVNEIRPKIALDRESRGTYELWIMSSNSDTGGPPDGIIDTNRVLKISVIILDVNDEIPIYTEVIFGSFLDTGNKGDQVAILEFIDNDLNDTILYEFGSLFVWNDGQNYSDPFTINATSNRISEIVLNMDPDGKYGYCSFSVVATDAANHSTSTMTEVFVVTNAYIVPFYFANNIDDVQENKANIENIFTDVFNYTSIIDSIEREVDSNNNPIEGQTIVNAHFIEETITNSSYRRNQLITDEHTGTQDTSKSKHMTTKPDALYSKDKISDKGSPFSNLIPQIVKQTENNKQNLYFKKGEPEIQPLSAKVTEMTYSLVPKEEIEAEGTNGEVTSDLEIELGFLGLNLVQIGDSAIVTDKDSQKITNLKIALGSVTLFLGLLVILLLIIYFVQTGKLEREVKVLSTSHVGPNSPEMDGMDKDVAQVPGSNLFAKEGTNPMWKLSEDQVKKATGDAESQGSWDSVLVGIEDNAQFSEDQMKKSVPIEENTITIDFDYTSINDEPSSSKSYGEVNGSVSSGSSNKGQKNIWESIELQDEANSERSSLDDVINEQLNSQFSFL